MKIIALTALLALAACADKEIVYQPTPVDVPVSVPCHAPTVATPVWPTASITDQTPFAQQVQAVLAEIKLRVGYEAKLAAAVGACQ